MKLSVIIPVYNTEEYLRQCLDSVINQTYKNLEIICIDDCSADGSYEILKEYEQKDNRIKVFKNEKNLRVGPTRNRGIELATGDYIHFMDSDDWLDLNAYEIYMDKIKGCYILSFPLREKGQNGKRTLLSKNSQRLKHLKESNSKKELYKYWDCQNQSKIYDRKFLISNKILYKDYDVAEDILFCYSALISAKNINIIDEALYNYRCNNKNSLSASRYKHLDSIEDLFFDVQELIKDLEGKEHICQNVFMFFFWSLWQAYKKRVIVYEELRNRVENAAKNISKENFLDSYEYIDEILTKPKLYVVIKNNIRQIISQHCPQSVKEIIKIFK